MPAISQNLHDLMEGLIYYSDSDNSYTIEALHSKSLEEVSAEIAALHNTSGANVKSIVADAFFQHIIDAADPNDAVIAANAKRTEALHLFLKENAPDLMVYRVETGVRIPIYIVGTLKDSSLLALKTMSVET